MSRRNKSKIAMAGKWYSFTDELSLDEENFFTLVENCDVSGVEKYMATYLVNLNMKNYQAITPLHLAIQNDCEPLVDLFLRQKGVRIGDSVLYAIAHDNLNLLNRLLGYVDVHGGKGALNADAANDNEDDSDEFRPFMTALMLAAQCGQYEIVEYLLSHGHRIDRPHPTRCACEDRCSDAARLRRGLDAVADGCKRLNTYQAISNPTYVCCTSADDPILVCFELHDELLECGAAEQVYASVYAGMAQQVRQFAVELLVNCRTSDEVKVLLRNWDGCKLKGRFPYPRLITAMDHGQKEFVAQSKVQQVLETEWIGDWIEWKSYSTTWRLLHVLLRFLMSPAIVLMGLLAPDSSLNRRNRLPINRMFNSLVAYSVFLVLLFYHSHMDKLQMRRGFPESPTRLPIAVFVLGHVVEKIKLQRLHGFKRYYKNMWNWFDTVKLALFSLAFLFWTAAELQTKEVDTELDRKYWHWADPQLIAEGLFTIATIMAYLRLLFLCQLNYYIGPMQVSLGKVLTDFVKFASFLIIIMVAFTFGLGTLYAYYAGMKKMDPESGALTVQENSFVSIPDTFNTLFWGIFCMASLDSPNVIVGNVGGDGALLETQQHYFTQLVGYGLFGVFEVLMVVVMLNIFIAAMSITFQRVSDNAEYEWLLGRTKVYVNYMLLDNLPPPFNLLPTTATVSRTFKSMSVRFNGGYAEMDDADDAAVNGSAEYRGLMVELIKRYFTHRNQP
ncbi:Ion transport domain,Transient receptor potential channel, canonical,Ankyrin repeat-containing [Cinara cedri]|uniref:Ion transport domain,Transient receptor potential channel, canonical,Ankyrin repeat-containing n=1 Tax=Cinara cedri TaxID=506608 RepID=A0A5E4NQZ3_9HEMI|nr:Ion transport domain,Transient receptor potential channel, canonical,Ankyrin repeat-containing [Cinara cedri]